MGPKGLFSSRLSKEIAAGCASWPCSPDHRGYIGHAPVATDPGGGGPGDLGVGVPRSDIREGSAHKPAPLYVVLAPVLVGLPLAYVVASDEWFAFAAIAIVFPLAAVWRHVYGRWEARRVGQNTA